MSGEVIIHTGERGLPDVGSGIYFPLGLFQDVPNVLFPLGGEGNRVAGVAGDDLDLVAVS